MINLSHRITRDALPMTLLLQVHDELVVEVERGSESEMLEIICSEMSGAVQLSVPLKVDAQIGGNWSEAH